MVFGCVCYSVTTRPLVCSHKRSPSFQHLPNADHIYEILIKAVIETLVDKDSELVICLKQFGTDTIGHEDCTV